MAEKKSSPNNKIDLVQRPFQQWIVDKILIESKSTRSFYLIPKNSDMWISFKPGQFITCQLDLGAQGIVRRNYTLSASPEQKGYYRITVKKLPIGKASHYLHNHIKQGDNLSITAPAGRFYLQSCAAISVENCENCFLSEDVVQERGFCLQPREKIPISLLGGPADIKPIVLLSAGIGITPMISMLNTLVLFNCRRSVWFIHGVRNHEDQVMGDHIRQIAHEYSHVNVHIYYSQPKPGDVEGVHYDHQGHITIDALKKILPNNQADFYLCGPSEFMRSLYTGLIEWQVQKTRIYFEFFGPASIRL